MTESSYESGKRGTDTDDQDDDPLPPSKRNCPVSSGSIGPCPPFLEPSSLAHSSSPQDCHHHQQQQQQQWLLRRCTESGHDNTMVVMEHLGDASTMVESLTHQFGSWSLISYHTTQRNTTTNNNNNNKKGRVQASKREMMKTLLGTKQQPQPPPQKG